MLDQAPAGLDEALCSATGVARRVVRDLKAKGLKLEGLDHRFNEQASREPTCSVNMTVFLEG